MRDCSCAAVSQTLWLMRVRVSGTFWPQRPAAVPPSTTVTATTRTTRWTRFSSVPRIRRLRVIMEVRVCASRWCISPSFSCLFSPCLWYFSVFSALLVRQWIRHPVLCADTSARSPLVLVLGCSMLKVTPSAPCRRALKVSRSWPLRPSWHWRSGCMCS